MTVRVHLHTIYLCQIFAPFVILRPVDCHFTISSEKALELLLAEQEFCLFYVNYQNSEKSDEFWGNC